jgi:hypothetical protein
MNDNYLQTLLGDFQRVMTDVGHNCGGARGVLSDIRSDIVSNSNNVYVHRKFRLEPEN